MLMKVIDTDRGRKFIIYEQYGKAPENVIAEFDALEDAALVKRYLSGAVMRNVDQEQAVLLMRAFDSIPRH